MDYTKIYDDLVSRASKRRGKGFDRHHIKPRCLGGGDEATNICRLTPREHLIAHHLLHRIMPGHEGLALAYFLMSQAVGRTINSRQYAKIREVLESTWSKIGAESQINGTGIFSKTPEAFAEHQIRAGNLSRDKRAGIHAQTKAQRDEARALGRAAWRAKVLSDWTTSLTSVGMTADHRPTLEEARQHKLTRFWGTPCIRHPELGGERVTVGARGCVVCRNGLSIQQSLDLGQGHG